MHIEPYLDQIPEIEARIATMKPDAIVMGLGPSSYLLPWVNQRLLIGVRRFGVNDVFRIMPVHDLVIMDPPLNWLDPNGERFQHIIKSRPDRWWIYPDAWKNEQREAEQGKPFWHKQLPACVRESVTVQPWRAYAPGELPTKEENGRQVVDKYGFNLFSDPPETTCMSPVGATTLAWKLGYRRIGVIGVDAFMSDHPSQRLGGMVNTFFRCIAKQAREAGGLICNLSPISQIHKLPAPSESLSEPTNGSGPLGLSGC